MSFEIKLTANKDSIELGKVFAVDYRCIGAYNATIQSDNMTSPIQLGSEDVEGTMKFLPAHTGPFNVTLVAHGVRDQNKGIDNMSNTETNMAVVTVNVV